KIVVVTRPRAFATGSMVALIWLASSRVGHSTRARGRRGWRDVLAHDRRETVGSENARVLPEPVRPRPRTSRPLSESGSVAVWMGKGESIPWRESSRTTGVGRPKSAKEVTGDGPLGAQGSGSAARNPGGSPRRGARGIALPS